MSLDDTLRGIREASEKRRSPEQLAIMHRATEDLRASGAIDRVIKPGDKLPPFALPNAHGYTVTSSDLLAHGPLVLTVYRGAW